MRTTHKTAGAVAAALTLALTLSACGSGGAEVAEPGSGEALNPDEDISISLAWWGDDDRAARYEKAVDLFEKDHPNITVQTQFQSFDDYWASRATEAAGGALPDVVQMDLSYLRQYGATGQLADLRAQEGVSLDVDGVDDTLLSSGEIEGAQYGIPTSTNTLAVFYNADLLEQLGIEPLSKGYTWDDYHDWIAKVSKAGKSQGKGPVIYGSPDYTGTFWFFLQWLVQQGTPPFTEDGKLNFDESQMAEWLSSGQDLRDSDAFYPIDRTQQILPLDPFTVSESASEGSWDNFLASFSAETEQDIKMLPMPSGDDGPQQFYKPSMLLSTSASSEQPAASAALVDFLINDPRVGKIFGTSKGVPAVQKQMDAMDVEPGSVDDRVVKFEQDNADLVTEPTPRSVEGLGELSEEYERLSEELQYGNIDVDEFVSQWFSFAQDKLDKS